jgi:zinc transport system ATP-binding protein
MSEAKPCGFHCIKINDIGVTIGKTEILKEVNLHIHCGKLTVVIGENGAGKSTLIKAILGEVKHSGNITFKDTKNNAFKDLKIGYVPQNLNIDKNTPTSVYDLFASFNTNTPVFIFKDKKMYEAIKMHLKKFDAEDLIDKEVCNLSGGELQRVLLSLATYPTPNLLILDEPVSGIDRNGMEIFYKNIDHLKNNYDLAIILISHDLDFVAKYADYVVLLNKTIIKEGTVSEVFNSSEFEKVFGQVKYLQEM